MADHGSHRTAPPHTGRPVAPRPMRPAAAAPANGLPTTPGGGWLGAAAVYGGAALLGAYMFQTRARSRAEHEHPPVGRFLDVEGTALHYVDIGSGPPVVLIHGNGTTLDDWFISGLVDHLLPHHRLIIVDRPGYGYSPRPSEVRWSPERQGRAIAHLMHRLGADRATIVGHGDGALPAIAIALTRPGLARALTLLNPVTFPGSAHTSAAASLPQLPVIGPLARVTALPAMARAALPAVMRASFEPQPVPRDFAQRFPAGLVTRPSQLAASAEDGAALDAATERFSRHYHRLDIPVTVVFGSGDGIVDPDRQARRFAATVDHARLIVVPAAGHMVHHTAPARVAAAILDTAAPRQPIAPARPAPKDTTSEQSATTPGRFDDGAGTGPAAGGRTGSEADGAPSTPAQAKTAQPKRTLILDETRPAQAVAAEAIAA